MRRPQLLFVLSILIATMFWVVFRFSQIDSISIEIPVKVENIPAGMSLPRLVQRSIKYSIQGKVFDLILVKNANIYIRVDMGDINVEDSSIPWQSFEVMHPSRFKSLKFEPTLQKDFYIETDLLVSRSIPIKLNFLNDEVKKRYIETGYNYNPKLIEATGAESVLDRLEFLETESITKENLVSNDVTVAILPPHENVLITNHDITILKPEKDIVSKTFSLVPVKVDSGEQSIPKWASIRLVGPKQQLDTLSVSSIIVKPDSSDKSTSTRKLDIILPPELMLLEFSPEKVQIIER